MFTIPNQINELVNPDSARREKAKKELIENGQVSVEYLVKALSSGSDQFRWKILQVLTEIGDLRAIPGFIECLNSGSPAIQAVAAQFLGNVGAQQAVEPMLDLLTKASDNSSHVWIINALGKIGDKRAIPPLLETLHTTESSTIRYTTIEALGALGDEQIIDAIRQYEHDPSHHVQDRVKVAIQNLRNRRASSPV